MECTNRVTESDITTNILPIATTNRTTFTSHGVTKFTVYLSKFSSYNIFWHNSISLADHY